MVGVPFINDLVIRHIEFDVGRKDLQLCRNVLASSQLFSNNITGFNNALGFRSINTINVSRMIWGVSHHHHLCALRFSLGLFVSNGNPTPFDKVMEDLERAFRRGPCRSYWEYCETWMQSRPPRIVVGVLHRVEAP